MLRLHMATIETYVTEFLVSESTFRFQTHKRKPSILSQNMTLLPLSIRRKTFVQVVKNFRGCPVTVSGFSPRCFQQVQRLTTLDMFLSRSSSDSDIAIVSDVDEIPKPEYLNIMRFCEFDALILRAHQFKFGLHCDSGVSWYEGPKLYSRKWLDNNHTAVSFDNLRRRSPYSLPYVYNAAWHLTSFGSEHELHRKLISFTAANLFRTPYSLDKSRLKRCMAGCYELLYKGNPASCDEPSIPKVGRKISTLPDDLPRDIKQNLHHYPSSWSQYLTKMRVVTSITSETTYYDHPVFKTTNIYALTAYFNGVQPPKKRRNVEYHNVSELQAWVETFIEKTSHSQSKLQRFYRSHPHMCIVRPFVNVCHDIFTVYKVGAIVDAVTSHKFTYVIWLDADSYIRKPLDSLFFAFPAKYQISTIGRKQFYPETGITVFNTFKPTDYIEQLKSFYTRSSFDFVVNDVVLFSKLSATFGFFAVDCMSSLVHREEVKGYQAKNLYCPGEDENVSTFHLFDYIVHRKLSNGLIHRALWNKHK